MSKLLDLPNELLLQIIHLVTPEGIEQLTLCCKEIYAVAQKALEVHRRRKQYCSVNCAYLEDHGDARTKSCHPLRLLADISLDEEIAKYTTEIFIGHCDDDYPYGHDPLVGKEREDLYDVGQLSELSEQWIRSQVMDCPYLDDAGEDLMNAEYWTEKILSGSIGESCALLITLLHNLESMTILDDSSFATALWEVVCRIAEAKFDSDRISSPALAKLNIANLSDGTVRQPLERFGSLAALPSMRSLHGCMISERFEDIGNFLWPYDQGISPVTELWLNYTSISAEGLWELFQGIRALESFSCIGGGVAGTRDWETTTIVDGLRLHARGSLRRLDLTYSKEDDADNECYGIARLSTFEVLRWVRLDVELLFDVNTHGEVEVDEALPGRRFYKTRLEDYHYGYEAQRLVDILLDSIETVELVGVLSVGNTGSMLAGLPELKRERVPRLERIVFEGHSSIDEGLAAQCESAGVLLEHKQAPWYTKMTALGLHHHH